MCLTPAVYADYVFSRLRRELGLWFEINEALPYKELALCQLTDGQSFIYAWLKQGAQALDENAVPLDDIEDLQARFTWQVGSDSRRKFSDEIVKSIISEALRDFKHNLQTEDRLSLIAFEFVSSREIRDFERWFQTRFEGIWKPMPEYQGLATDDEKFQLVEDKTTSWGQISFHSPLPVEELISTLARSVKNIKQFRMASRMTFKACGELESLGLDSISLLGRRY